MSDMFNKVSDEMHQVFWITGLSGAGKTTIGKELYERLKRVNPATVFLDGDIMREVFGGDLGYSYDQRLTCAMRYSRLCKLLFEQQLTVICCTISMFDSIRNWNRANIPGYVEIYIKTSQEVLFARNQKGLYTGRKAGGSSDVMGLDIPCEEPKTPDIVIDNNGILTVDECIDIISNYIDRTKGRDL